MDPRAAYWTKRYDEQLDWPEGVHIGRFVGLGPNAKLEEASYQADSAVLRSIYEYCSLFRLVTEFRVLEIGCGTGGLAFRLLEAVPNLHYLGLDVSASAICTAKGRSRSNTGADDAMSARLHFAVGGVGQVAESIKTHYPAAGNGFDLIIIREVYYLLSGKERQQISDLVNSQLRPGGFVYFADIFCLNQEIGEELQEHLYTRHHALGDKLALDNGSEETFATWCTSQFGDSFVLAPKSYVCDTGVVSQTYRYALQEQDISETNRRAYSKLADIGDPKHGPRLAYIFAFLFSRGAIPSLKWNDCDYHFTARRGVAEAILPGQSYGIHGNSWTLLLGRSGAGKTTVLRALEGEWPTIVGSPSNLLEDTRYFFLSQDIDLFRGLSPIDNVRAFAAKREAAKELLAQLGHGSEFWDRPNSNDISGGERQRLAIAQCITSRPDVVLLDEPLKGLDKARRAILFEFLDSQLRREPNNRGETADRVTLVCVDHDFDTIYRRFDHVYEIIQGHQVLVWEK